MSDSSEEIECLLHKAVQLDDGRTKIALLEEAIQQADHAQIDELALVARQELILAAYLSDHVEKAAIALAWCLSRDRHNPNCCHDERTLWSYVPVADHLAYCLDVPRKTLEEIVDDLKFEFQRAGLSIRPVEMTRRSIAMALGDPELANAAHLRWSSLLHESSIFDEENERGPLIQFYLFSSEYKKATASALPWLEQRTGDRPQHAFAGSLLCIPYLRIGDPHWAETCHRRGLNYYRNRDGSNRPICIHLAYQVIRGEESSAVRLAGQYAPKILATSKFFDRLLFARSCTFLFEQLAADGKGRVKLRLPESFPLHNPDGDYDTGELAHWFRTEMTDIARRFDLRNGNDYYTRELIGELEEIKELRARYRNHQ